MHRLNRGSVVVSKWVAVVNGISIAELSLLECCDLYAIVRFNELVVHQPSLGHLGFLNLSIYSSSDVLFL